MSVVPTLQEHPHVSLKCFSSRGWPQISQTDLAEAVVTQDRLCTFLETAAAILGHLEARIFGSFSAMSLHSIPPWSWACSSENRSASLLTTRFNLGSSLSSIGAMLRKTRAGGRPPHLHHPPGESISVRCSLDEPLRAPHGGEAPSALGPPCL